MVLLDVYNDMILLDVCHDMVLMDVMASRYCWMS